MALKDAPETLSARLEAELRGQLLVPGPIKALLLELAHRLEVAEGRIELLAPDQRLFTSTTIEGQAWPLPKL